MRKGGDSFWPELHNFYTIYSEFAQHCAISACSGTSNKVEYYFSFYISIMISKKNLVYYYNTLHHLLKFKFFFFMFNVFLL